MLRIQQSKRANDFLEALRHYCVNHTANQNVINHLVSLIRLKKEDRMIVMRQLASLGIGNNQSDFVNLIDAIQLINHELLTVVKEMHLLVPSSVSARPSANNRPPVAQPADFQPVQASVQTAQSFFADRATVKIPVDFKEDSILQSRLSPERIDLSSYDKKSNLQPYQKKFNENISTMAIEFFNLLRHEDVLKNKRTQLNIFSLLTKLCNFNNIDQSLFFSELVNYMPPQGKPLHEYDIHVLKELSQDTEMLLNLNIRSMDGLIDHIDYLMRQRSREVLSHHR